MAESTAAPDLQPLIGAAELRGMDAGRELLIVDCRHDLARPDWGASVYAEGHLPGAVFAALDRNLSGPILPGTGRHPLPDPADFAGTLGSWGLTPTTRVVAYDQGPGAYAARLWWMLRAIGHRAQVLDGGLAAWTAAGGALTTARPAPTRSTVPVRAFAGVVGTAQLQGALAAGSVTLVDARGADRFAGQNETIDPVAGHVPGAINHPYGGNLASDGRTFLAGAELAQRWQGELQAARRAPIVAMCGSGVTACHNLLALELAGYRDGRLYAGSFSEWITDPRRPVATGVS